MRAVKGHPAFTLIEILVSISVIALLVGITIPALSSARETSRRVKCLANLRSIGQGLQGYMNDSRDRLPEVRPLHGSGTQQNDLSLLDVMANYLDVPIPEREVPGDATTPFVKVSDVFKCPGDVAGKDAASNYEPLWRSSGVSYEYFAGSMMFGAWMATVRDPAKAVTLTYEMPRWKDLPVMNCYADWHQLRRRGVPRNALYFGSWNVDWASPLLKVDSSSPEWPTLICDIVSRNGGVPIPGCN